MKSAQHERPLWNESVERMTRDAMCALQLQRLKDQVTYNYANSEFYRAKFDSIGMKPGDVRSFDDFARLPLMTKDEHRQAQAESGGGRLDLRDFPERLNQSGEHWSLYPPLDQHADSLCVDGE